MTEPTDEYRHTDDKYHFTSTLTQTFCSCGARLRPDRKGVKTERWELKAADPTLLDSEIEDIINKLGETVAAHPRGQGPASAYHKAHKLIKDLIATTVNEVIGQDEREMVDTHSLIRNGVRAKQRSKLQELMK